MYITGYSKFKKLWLVINRKTGMAQSAWADRLSAIRVCYALNLKAR